MRDNAAVLHVCVMTGEGREGERERALSAMHSLHAQ